MNFQALAQPGKIGALTLKNRLVAPAVNNNYTQAGFMSQLSIDSYLERAKGGAGLIITEATSVDYPLSRSVLNPALDDDRYIDGFSKIAEGCHAYGAKVLVQLNHVGRQTKKRATGMAPVAPSAIGGNSPLYPDPPRVLTLEEIDGIFDQFAQAALRAKKSGCDGVELNMGHGYLVNNFLSPLSNQRTDEYGGLSGGIRFAANVVKAIKALCGEAFVVVCRINGDDFVQKNGNTIVETQLIAQELEKAGADAINVSGGMRDSEQNFNDHTCGTPHGSWLSLAERIKRTVSIPVIAVKRITPAQAAEAVASGAVDFIALGKQSIADPAFAQKILENRLDDLIPCTSCCQGCYDKLWMWSPITCLLNPEAGKTQAQMEAHRSLRGQSRVLVAGAGPAGCELAAELASMGHRVTLIEKEDRIGGSYAYSAMTQRKCEVGAALRYLQHRLDQTGVDVRLHTPLTQELLDSERFDVVVNATGAAFVHSMHPGDGLPLVLDPKQAMLRKDEIGPYVAIITCSYGCPWTCRAVHHPIPDDIVGMETSETHACSAGFAAADLAEELADCGKKVEILTERAAFVQGIGFTNRNYMLKRFFTKNISVSNEVKVLSLIPGGMLCEKDGMTFKVAADCVVVSCKQRASASVKELLQGCAATYYEVGDCAQIGNALEAIHSAYHLAERITLEQANCSAN